MADARKKGSAKVCGVCGDHALGSNFNAITCESCKAFFRRNALKTKEFKCPFSDNCKVDIITRRFCQKCRLKKCFNIGMKKEWIMSEEEKKAKRAKIEKNREKKGKVQSVQQMQDFTYVKVESPDSNLNQAVLSPAASMSPLTPLTPGSAGNFVELPKSSKIFAHQPLTPSDCEYSPPSKVLHTDSALDVHNDSQTSSEHLSQGRSDSSPNPELTVPTESFDESKLSSETVEESQSSPIPLFSSPFSGIANSPEEPLPKSGNGETVGDTNSDTWNCHHSQSGTSPSNVPPKEMIEQNSLRASVYAKAVDIEFTDLPIRSSVGTSKELTTLEKLKLEELVVANEILKMPLMCGLSDPSLLDVINMTDHAIRRLIKMSKKINAFKNLCQNDQIALLKGGCTELMILRSVMSYDPEKECWRGPQGPKIMSIKVEILKEARGNLYEEHKRFINSFHPDWRGDENIMLILSGITLFTPERPNTIHRDVIKLEQDSYYYLLRRYLETMYSWCEARTTYLSLIHKIQELHILNENHVRVYLDVNPKDVEPLLIEIFDLKH